jgi:D-arginine dehydrogenase
MIQEFDFAVIGAGMAGASIAAQLSEHASVHLFEMEAQPGYHSTGRSAAIFAQTYGNSIVRALTRASRAFFYSPPPGFCSTPLVKPRAVMVTARTGQEAALAAFIASIDTEDHFDEKSADEAIELCPVLRPNELIGAVFSQSPADIEVHELQRGYLRMLKARSGQLTTAAKVLGAERTGDTWTVTTTQGTHRAKNIVNAAGAWAGEIAKRAGAQDIGLRPLKRTVCLIESPTGRRSDSWPMLLDVEEQFYLKPDAGKLLLSPADETVTEPCDAQPDELDIAIAVDRLEHATTLKVARIAAKWAGLRSFVQDRTPVVGYDALQPGFFWLAALGGYGIQTAPALSRLAATLALRRNVGEDLLQCGVDLATLSPDRFLAKIATKI